MLCMRHSGWRILLSTAFVLPLCGCAAGRPPLAASPAQATPSASNPTTTVITAAATANAGGAPGISGSRLNVPPGESAAAKALVLTNQLASAKSENDRLAARLHQLESELEAKDKALARATADVALTRTELTKARAELERWKQELVNMREKLQVADKESVVTLQTTVSLLQQLLAREQPDAVENH